VLLNIEVDRTCKHP